MSEINRPLPLYDCRTRDMLAKYQTDAFFHSLVNHLRELFRGSGLTAVELEQAARLALTIMVENGDPMAHRAMMNDDGRLRMTECAYRLRMMELDFTSYVAALNAADLFKADKPLVVG